MQISVEKLLGIPKLQSLHCTQRKKHPPPMSLSNDKTASASLRSSGGDTTGSSNDEVTAELRHMKQKQRERRLTDAVSVALSVLEAGSSMVEKTDDLERGRNLLQEEEGLSRVRRFANQGTSVLESKEISAMLLELNQKEAECVGGSRQSSKLRYQRRPFYSPPRQRQKWGDDVALQHSEWGDLFYDLFYVAAAYNLGNLLTSSLEPDLYKKGVMYFVAIFGSLYIAWEESVLYQSRYATGDYFHQFVNILRILFVSLSIIHIDPIYMMSDPSSADNFYFTLGLLVVNIITICLTIELIYCGKGDVESIRNHSRIKLVYQYLPGTAFFIAAVALAGWKHFDLARSGELRKLAEDSFAKASKTGSSSWTINDLPIGLLLIRYVFVICEVLIRKKIFSSDKRFSDFRKWSVPTNIDFLIDRYKEFNMLMLGEPVLSLLIVSTVEISSYYIVALLGVTTVIGIALIKFGSDPVSIDDHALWRSMMSGTVYSFLLQILSLSLIAYGACYKDFLKKIEKESQKLGVGFESGKNTFSTEDTFEDDRGRMLIGGTVYVDDAGEALFCAAVAVVLISLELMGLAHFEGMRKSFRKIFSGLTTIILFVLKIVLLFVTATLFLWVEGVGFVAIAGLLIVGLFLFFRVIEWNIQARRELECSCADHATDGSDDEEH